MVANRRLVNISPGGVLNPSSQNVAAQSITSDTRARLSLSPGSGNILYNDDNNVLLSPLRNTGGIQFPYTPAIQLSYSANYTEQSLAHTNYAQQSYGNSSINQITVTGQFTSNREEEARYVLAVIHFLRSATKMFYGRDENRGAPPPVLRFSAYGTFMFTNLPVVIAQTTLDLDSNVDYIDVIDPELSAIVPSIDGSASSTRTQIPTQLQISMTLIPIVTRTQSLDFSLRDYARGSLLGNAGAAGGYP